MKIAVCIKQVPVVSMMKFDRETKRLIREGIPVEVNYFDIIAMSLAVDIKQYQESEVVVLTMGPPQAKEALIQCIAMGADRAIHLMDSNFVGSDTLATSRALSMALELEQPDLIICGVNSVDSETGQVGPQIAEFLDVPQITNVTKFTVNVSTHTAKATRLTELGYDEVECELPLLITVTEGAADEKYPKPQAIENAKTAYIQHLESKDLSVDDNLFGHKGSPTHVTELENVVLTRMGTVIKEETVEKAIQFLLEFLEEHQICYKRTENNPPFEPEGSELPVKSSKSIWVLTETLNGKIRPVTFELLGGVKQIAHKIGASVIALLIGYQVESETKTLGAYGADAVYIADDFRLASYDTETHTDIVVKMIKRHQPYAIVSPSTILGRDLAARVSARLNLGLTGDCIGLKVDSEGKLAQLKPAFGGNIVAPIVSSTFPQMTTLRPGVLTSVSPNWSANPEKLLIDLPDLRKPRVRILRSVETVSEDANIEQARIVIGVGRGVGEYKNLSTIRRLAKVLGATIGGTRDVVDIGWMHRQQQIGLSGKTIAPDLYIAIGIRGPFNHTVGIQKAGKIIAINNNARAPIFKMSDFGIVADYAEILPALIRAIESGKLNPTTAHKPVIKK